MNSDTPLHSKLAYVVVIGQLAIALTLVGAICGCLFFKNYADPSTLAAVIVMAGTLIGNLGSILGGPRSMMMTPRFGEVKISNSPDQPVPVTEKPTAETPPAEAPATT